MTEKQKNIIASISVFILYILLIRMLMPFVYGIIDDRSMMEIVSGQYLGHPDAHTIFMGYWYSLVLAGLYRLMPNVDWYALLYLVMQGMCISLISYRLISRYTEWIKKLISLFIFYLLYSTLGIRALTQLTFTTTAAVLGVTVVFWYLTTRYFTLKDVVILSALGFLACQVRVSVFYMIVPVCGVLWLFRISDVRMRQKWHLMIPLMVLGILLLDILGNRIGYGSANWQAYQQYNAERSLVYDYADYTFPIYEEAEDFYNSIGIEKKSRARTLINYNYTADARISQEFFGDYIKAYQTAYPSEETLLEKIWQSTKDYIKGVLNKRFHLQHMLSLGLYVLLILWYLFKKNYQKSLKVIAVIGIQVLLWIYLLYEGRIPDRVIYTMNLMLTVTALLLCLEIVKKIPAKLRVNMLCVVFVMLCVLTTAEGTKIRQQNLEISHHNQEIESLKEYCMEHPENFYFNDVTSLAFTTYNVHLWQKTPYQMNYMSLGDWMSFSPVWEEKLLQHKITSVQEALYQQDYVYLICSFDKGLEYLISLYDNVTCTEIDKIPGFHIYRLQSL